MTQTERQYVKNVGKLFWSVKLGSLVMVVSLDKKWGRWRYTIDYTNPDMSNRTRSRDAKEIATLIKQGIWITAADFLTLREKSQQQKSA